MQFQIRENDDSCQPQPQYSNPPVVVEERRGAPLLNCSGLVLVCQLMERLGVASAIDCALRVRGPRGGVLHRRQAAPEPDERSAGDSGEPLEAVG